MQKFLYWLRQLPRWQKITGGVLGTFFLLFILVWQQLGQLTELGFFRFTGWPGGRNYLVIFQNDAERRPTGGFISAYAILKFRFGVPLVTFGNVYDKRLIQPDTEIPDPTIRGMLAGPHYPGHGFRDGNLDPDFPTSAKELIRLYRQGYPKTEFDGVLAVDFTAFSDLVEAVGGVSVGEAKFQGDTLFAELEHIIQNIDLHDPAELANRKNILGDLAKGLIRRAPGNITKLADSVLTSLQSKHILFYFTDPKLQARVEARNWAGRLPFTVDSDLLAVNEGNYGGMKSSRYLVRDLDYDIKLSDESLSPTLASRKGRRFQLSASARLDLKVEHRGDATEPISGYYKGYWRVYAPLGSQLVQGQVDTNFDDGRRQVFGKILQMNPGEIRELILDYDLPNFVINSGIYKLKLIKQPGSAADHVRVTVKAPVGYLFQNLKYRHKSQIIPARQKAKFDLRENLAIFETNLTKDVELALQVIPDTTPPGLAWQEFRGGLSTIDLRFNEPLDSGSVQNAAFELTDLNHRNDRTDSITVQRATFIAPQNIQLTVSGVSEECREWYRLKIKGVTDLHGNSLDDREVTVVQWVDKNGTICDPNNKL